MRRRRGVTSIGESEAESTPHAIAESIWPNDAYPDGKGINTLTGADEAAPYGGAAFHDNKVWVRRAAA